MATRSPAKHPLSTRRSHVPSLTLVYLMYNEEGNIARALDQALAFADSDLDDVEIIVVNDGSTDGGPAIVEQYQLRDPRVRLVHHMQNQGMGAGMRTGIRNASREYLVFMPSDCQLEPVELRKMLPLLGGADIILSVYPHRHSTFARAVMSRVFRDMMMLAADIHFQLEGLYLYPVELAKKLEPRITCNSFFFSFELIARGLEQGATSALTTIDVKPRHTGTSKVTGLKRIARVAREVLDYRRRRANEG